MKQATSRKAVWFISLLVLLALSAEVSAQRSRRRELYGDWEVKADFNGRQMESILSFFWEEDDTLTGEWIGWRGVSELKDIEYEGGQLSFVRAHENREGQSTKSKFTGTIEDGKLSGTISSERGEYKLEGRRSQRMPRAVGSWEMKLKTGEEESTAKLVINSEEGGNLTGQWQDERGEHEITDVKYERGRLMFRRKSKVDALEWESIFGGRVRRDSLLGAIKSKTGETAAEGKRIGTRLIGTWNLEVTSERGSRKQRLKVNRDMSGMYGAIPIKKVHLEENKVSFETVVEFGERKFEMSFEGQLEESRLTGELTTSRGSQKVTGAKVIRRFRRRDRMSGTAY